MSTRDVTDHDGAGGPKWKITAQRKDRIVTAVRAGNYHYVAAQWAGIGKSTFYKYMDLGDQVLVSATEDGIYDVEADPESLRPALVAAGYAEHEILCAELVDEVTRAEAEVEVRLVTNWSQAAANDWRAARDLLARRHAPRWRDQSQLDIGGIDGGPVRIDVSSDQLRAAMEDPEAIEAASSMLAALIPSSPRVNERRFEDAAEEDDELDDEDE